MLHETPKVRASTRSVQFSSVQLLGHKQLAEQLTSSVGSISHCVGGGKQGSGEGDSGEQAKEGEQGTL